MSEKNKPQNENQLPDEAEVLRRLLATPPKPKKAQKKAEKKAK